MKRSIITISASKHNFFDKKVVIDAIGKVRAGMLSKAGSLVRKVAQGSLKYDDKPSRPGQPPHAHKSRKSTRTSKRTGKKRTRLVSFLREFLYFSYDSTSNSVVVGPEKLNSTVDSASLRALEEGGTSVIVDHGKRKSVRIKARPFMQPALKQESPKFAAMWRNSVR